MSTLPVTPPVASHYERLYQWVKHFAAPTQNLRWVHTTDAFALRNILEQRSLSPQLCPVFNCNLTYLFYGRPAYRFNRLANMRSTFNAPAVLVFREKVFQHAHRLFPFDTGAFVGGRYKKWLHPAMQLTSFEYPANEDGQGRHITAFYGENRKYWNGEGLELQNIAGLYEVEAVRDMINDMSTDEADDRRLAIELLVKDIIPMNADYLEVLYVPTSVADADFVKTFEKETGVPVATFSASRMKPTIEYQGLLEHLLDSFHAEMGAM